MKESDSVMSRNDLEMLLLGLPINELNLLNSALFQQAIDNPTIDIDVKAYAASHYLPINTAYTLLEAAAQDLFEHKFCYKEGLNKFTSTLISDLVGNAATYKLSLKLCHALFNSLQELGTTELDDLLTNASKPPVSLMSRAYSAKLYLMITDLYNNNEVLISYDFLRKSLGIKSTSYLLIHNFKRRVLNPAIADINEFSSLSVSYIDITDGRKITGFKFIVTPNQPNKTQG